MPAHANVMNSPSRAGVVDQVTTHAGVFGALGDVQPERHTNLFERFQWWNGVDSVGVRAADEAEGNSFVRRGGERAETTVTLEEDPRVEIVPVEQAGGTLSPEQRRFRDAWLVGRK